MQQQMQQQMQGGQMQQQMQQQNTTVVVQQPMSNSLQMNTRDWNNGLFGCFDDFMGCLCAFCCLYCMMCSLANRMNENCCVPICIYGGTMAMRTKLRTQHNIRGSICSDCCAVTFCGECVICQMDRELKILGRF